MEYIWPNKKGLPRTISDDEQRRTNARRTGESCIKRIVYTQKKSNNSDHLLGLFFYGLKFYGIFFYVLIFYGYFFYRRIFYVMAHSMACLLSMGWGRVWISPNLEKI